MAHPTDTQTGGTGTGGISTGWRVFQVVALLTALGWLASYLLYTTPGAWISSLLSGELGLLDAWGSIVFDLSPILSFVIIGLAVFPERLRFLTQRDDWMATLARIVIFVLPALWIINVFIGPRSIMIDKLISQPMNPSKVVPFTGGVFLHVVFQHWFQAFAAIALALVPEKFSTLTESATPAGVQCAVVDCD